MATADQQPFLHVAEPKEPPKPPRHLRAPTRRWWSEVVGDYVLEGHHLRLLQLAGEAWDRAQQAREQLQAEGLTVPTADGGLKPHPCVGVEKDSAVRFARLLREIDLDAGEPAPDPRLPRRR